MLSNKAKYGVRALIHMAMRTGKGRIVIKDIASKERIPQKFLEAILLELKSAGILQSKPGRGGGYYLHRPPESINLGRVIRLIDGPLAPIPCVSQTAYASCKDCLDEQRCVIRGVMKKVRDATAKILDDTTLADLVREQERLDASCGEIDFHI